MDKEPSIKLFENKKIRTQWDQQQEKWYFSIIDVIAILTDSLDPNNYWKVLKLIAPDGKMRMTDVGDTEQILRLIQSIPSPKAEPFKQWLAQVGYQRIQEIENPELAQKR